MILGKVIGTIVSTRKCSNLTGYKLLSIKPLLNSKEHIFVAADRLGAGIGDCVLITTGSSVQHALDRPAPIDAIVVGIVDVEPQMD